MLPWHAVGVALRDYLVVQRIFGYTLVHIAACLLSTQGGDEAKETVRLTDLIKLLRLGWKNFWLFEDILYPSTGTCSLASLQEDGELNCAVMHQKKVTNPELDLTWPCLTSVIWLKLYKPLSYSPRKRCAPNGTSQAKWVNRCRNIHSLPFFINIEKGN